MIYCVQIDFVNMQIMAMILFLSDAHPWQAVSYIFYKYFLSNYSGNYYYGIIIMRLLCINTKKICYHIMFSYSISFSFLK